MNTRRQQRPRLMSVRSLALVCLSLAEPQLASASGPADELHGLIAARAAAVEPKLVAWRRDFHAHPELGNQERRTSSIVAKHLKRLGLKVRTGVARTGVVAVLEGAAGGPVVALRADMDALPVEETTGLPYASKQKGRYRGQEVPVMHACGHDGHTAILLAVAEVLVGLKAKLPGTVVFYFQPAEEGPSDFVPDGKNTWGAKMMIEEGAMRTPRPAAVFGLHLWAKLPAGQIAYRPGPTMASSDDLRITVIGKQTHAGSPWDGVDPVVMSAQVILGIQTIVSRQLNQAGSPTVISIGTIQGGTRYNIIPERVQLGGTIRSFDRAQRSAAHEYLKRTVEHTVAAAGGRSELTILEKYGVTINDPTLTERSVPALRWAAHDAVTTAPLKTGSEDFSFMANEVPGLFFFLGTTPKGQDPNTAPPNHNPSFTIDESTLNVGVRVLAALATDFLSSQAVTGAALSRP